MKITLHIDNRTKKEGLDPKSQNLSDLADRLIGLVRKKSYESDLLDKDMIDSPVGKTLELFEITDLQISMKNDCDEVIELLNNVKESLPR